MSSVVGKFRRVFLSATFLSLVPLSAVNAEMEEVVVTAQRAEQNIQEVPIAVSALSGELMQDKGVLVPSDLQMNSPSVSFTATNFGGSSFSIRGIGNLVVGGESGVSTHVNEIALSTNLNAVEFYDMERVEVLRGPQGTLFGRNATGGAINFVTKKPDFASVGGFLDLEAGDYNNRRVKGALNVPVTDNFAVRIAGMDLSRDGYIDNLAYGQVGTDGSTIANIDDDVDGRDITTFRVTASWNITDNASLWVMYYDFDEDDDRVRITNQVCKQNPVPTTGCEPNEFGFESPHLLTTTGGLFSGIFAGLLPLAAEGTVTHPKPPDMGLRDMHTDFEPEFQDQEELWAFRFDYQFDQFTFDVSGAYQEREYLARQDYLMDVGFKLPFDIPVSRPAGGAGAEWTNPDCNYLDGTSGAFGGCILESADPSRVFAYDQSDSSSEYWTIEAKVASSFSGPFNFVLGANSYEGESYGSYYVLANTLETLGLYPGFFNNTDEPSQPSVSKGWATFGEAYFDVSPDVKITVGLRYNDDTREDYGTNVFVNSFDLNAALGGALGAQTFVRSAFGDFVGGAPLGDQTDLAKLYGVTQDQIDAANATGPASAERIGIMTTVPPVPRAAEARHLTGSPTEFDFDKVSGRVGVDWKVTDTSMLYAFFSRGYKPGGLNPAIPTDFQDTSSFSFDSEEIDSIELGSKNTFFNGSLVLNGSFYVYDYSGLQVTRIVNNSSINENIDADIMGLEIEGQWRPSQAPAWKVDWAYSWTDTEVDGSESIDPVNRTAGDPDWITLNNFDPSASAGVNFVAVHDEITPAVVGGCFATSPPGVLPLPNLSYPDGTPALWSRPCLDAFGVTTSDGLPTDLDGNELPNTPDHSLSLGVEHTWQVPALAGALTLRWDYYWQSESYAREFNTRGDEIDSWDQHNAQLIYKNTGGEWTARAFVRNIQDEENVTGKYLTSDTSGFFRNYFLTEPRIYGLSVKYNFGQ